MLIIVLIAYALALSSCLATNVRPHMCIAKQRSVSCCALPPARIRVRTEQRIDTELVHQGQVGACHAFATSEVFFQKTNLKLSKTRLFLDHLLSVELMGPDAQKALYDKLVEKNLKYAVACHFSFEGSNFESNMRLLQQVGGVLVPDNQDWGWIDNMFENIRHEVRIQQKGFIHPDENIRRQRLGDAGLKSLIQVALSETHDGRSTAHDRNLVKEAASRLKPEKIVFNQESLQDKADQLVQVLANHGAIYLSIYPAYLKKVKSKEILTELHPSKGGHAVALLAYDVGLKQFFIKDSADGKIWRLDAAGVAASTFSGWYLKEVSGVRG